MPNTTPTIINRTQTPIQTHISSKSQWKHLGRTTQKHLQLLLLIAGVEPNPGPDNRKLTISHVNINSITAPGKLDELTYFVEMNNIDILLLTETKLDHTIHPSLYSLPSFHPPYLNNRNRHGGGTATYIRSTISANRLTDLELDGEEWTWTMLKINNTKVITCSLYLPPNLSAERLDVFLDKLTDSITTAQRFSPTSILIMGDFNSGNIYLDRQHTMHSGITSFDIKLKDTIETLDLTQVINQPTRETEHIANLRDLVITNSTELITDCGTLPPFSTIDHYPVYVTLDITQPNIPPKSFTHWDYARLDANKLTKLLMDTDWDSILDEDIDIATEKFTSAILGAASSSIPKKTKQIRHKDKPWMTNYLKLNIRKRDRLFKLARKRQSQEDWDKWKQQRNFATLLNRQLRDQHIHTQVGKLLHNKHDAFKYHKTLTTLIGHNKGPSIPPLSTDDSLNGTTVTDEQEKSNILNDFFASQTQLTDIPSLPDTTADTDREPVPALNSITVEKEEVLNLLNSLDTNKSTGPDQLPSKILKMSALLIYEPLTKLFKKSLNTATFPKSWKVANITPIFKNKGSASNPANYRPISILPCLSKILEKNVFRRIYHHVTAQNLLSEKQSGYRPHHSTQLQLVHLTHNIDKALDRGGDFTAIYLDITKYFDKIWHSGLLYKCRNNFHITDKILDWLKSYLTDRQHRVRLGDTYSNIRTINVGCPQGSILGPLLAILYLDELAYKTENTALLYADDISLYSSHSTQNANTIQRSLQRDLDFIERYGKKWAITFSQTKTISQTFSNNHRPSTLTLTFSGQQIQSTDSHKHLGLHLSKDLRYHKHVNDIIRKVNIALSPLYSIASKLPRQVLEQIYKTYIRPYFDYCDAVFDGHLTAYDKRRLETLQNRAARLVTGTLYRTSSDKLRLELGWERLSTRREYTD